MCGICGKINMDVQKPIDRALVKRMCDVIEHRGPDDDGYFFHRNVGMAMRRLSIIDLSTGKQPLYNEDGTVAVVLNGEIYNFPELREQLIGLGHTFRTKTDTEVIVHLYEEKGEACVNDLRGMFGFAIYDTKKDRLMLARDRFGIKPVYYALDGDKFLFGSELKSLLQDNSLKREFDLFALNSYFSFMNTLAPDSIFQNVKKLLPGEYLIYQNGKIDLTQYWHFEIKSDGVPVSASEYQQQLFELLKESVKIRLISDVPLGAFLSGGVDSSAVVALMSQVSNRAVKTFSVGFDFKEFDESPYARKVAQLFETDHHEYRITPDATDILDDLVWFLDEPFADPSAIPTYFISKVARKNVTVVLTGDGGDEMFGGYPHYRGESILNRIARMPAFFRNGVLKNLLKVFPRTPHAEFNYQKERLLRNLDRIGIPPEARFFSRHQLFGDEAKKALYSNDLAQKMNGEMAIDERLMNILRFPYDENAINKLLYLDTHLYLPNDMLMKVDRMSMANSLEARVPLLDHKLAEFVATIPSHLKVEGMETKAILKKTMSHLLPQDILYRKKQGFDVPLNRWFRKDLSSMAKDILLGKTSTQRGLFNSKYVEEILDRHQKKEKDLSFQIWSLLIFEKWCCKFMDAQPGNDQ